MVNDIRKIRNFAIIAHIDHGKSTLSDRIISICGGLSQREMKDQVLDSLNVERQRGITVKAQSVSLKFEHKGEQYTLNLIDTPGHVDFSYEVRRSLSACEGVILLVDAKQGIQAQTVANVRIAKEKGLAILPVLNKIDLPGANPKYVGGRIKELLKIEKEPLLVSSKTGVGVQDLLHEIIEFIPSPKGSADDNLQALIVDSWYDQHAGIIILSRIYNGQMKKNTKIMFLSNGREYKIDSVGVFTPKKDETEDLSAGMVGYVIANIRNIQDCAPGDTITQVGNKCDKLPGFVKMKPYVFCGIYPENKDEYPQLKKSLERLQLNDGGIFVQASNIPVLGSGFRCGFLGLLHLEVVQQRLSEEFGIEIITTTPGVFYRVITKKGEEIMVEHPTSLPDQAHIESISEPWVELRIFTLEIFVGEVIELCNEKRGIIKMDEAQYIGDDQVILIAKIPLSEIIQDFHDRLKSITEGYASFEYELSGYEKAEIVVLRILVHGEEIDMLSCLIHKDRSVTYGRWLCEKLKECIDRQQFAVAIQAFVGGKVIARETLSPYRKDVTAKCYGGDVTRKRKLLDRQKEGKERMQEGNIRIDHKKIRNKIFMEKLS